MRVVLLVLTLVLVGASAEAQNICDPRWLETHKSDWVAWEIDKAIELKRVLIAVKTDRLNTSPANLLNAGATWALSFTFDAIKKALDES